MMSVRLLLLPLALAATSFAQTAAPPAALGGKRASSDKPPASSPLTAANGTESPAAPAPVSELSGDAPVITIRGLCPEGGSESSKRDGCVMQISKDQFERMISAMSFNRQAMNNPVALRTFAESYVQALALSDAAEKAGLDKDPQFQELMAVVRIRTLADAYRRLQKEQLNNVAPEDIEAYYEANAEKFEQVELDRIFIPKNDRTPTKQSSGEFEKKAAATASQMRERAARGEDLSKLQLEAYKSLGLTPPLTTDMGTIRRGALPRAIEEDVFSLKAGDVTRVETDAAGFTVYRIRSRATLPLERVKQEIAHELGQKKMDTAAAELAKQVHGDYNEQFFSTQRAKGKDRSAK
jgi:PPIC-type PPIASE domain